MKISETPKKLGRAFNHLEDLVFFYGTEGTIEVLDHLKDIYQNASSIRMKWDGSPQIYWGRNEINGPLLMAGHNGWARGSASSSSEELYDFIANKSGSPKTPEEKANRELFAKQFAQLYPLFDKATPKTFTGFVYADALFLAKPELDEHGMYNFYPNPKSNTGYHVSENTDLGKRIHNASVMVVGHATFDKFGAPDSEQKPKDDFTEFNNDPNLIVVGPYYTKVQPKLNVVDIDAIESFISQESTNIDKFLEPMKGVSAFKDYIYKYMNTMAKQRQLSNIDSNFISWLEGSNISVTQQQKIKDRMNDFPEALPAIFSLIKQIMHIKNSIIDQLDNDPGEIIASNSEGWVRYADHSKKFGNVKFVPRHRWIP